MSNPRCFEKRLSAEDIYFTQEQPWSFPRTSNFQGVCRGEREGERERELFKIEPLNKLAQMTVG